MGASGFEHRRFRGDAVEQSGRSIVRSTGCIATVVKSLGWRRILVVRESPRRGIDSRQRPLTLPVSLLHSVYASGTEPSGEEIRQRFVADACPQRNCAMRHSKKVRCHGLEQRQKTNPDTESFRCRD